MCLNCKAAETTKLATDIIKVLTYTDLLMYKSTQPEKELVDILYDTAMILVPIGMLKTRLIMKIIALEITYSFAISELL